MQPMPQNALKCNRKEISLSAIPERRNVGTVAVSGHIHVGVKLALHTEKFV